MVISVRSDLKRHYIPPKRRYNKSFKHFINFVVRVILALSTCLNLSLPAANSSCRLLITFANSLDPDQVRQNDRLDLDQNCLTP